MGSIKQSAGVPKDSRPHTYDLLEHALQVVVVVVKKKEQIYRTMRGYRAQPGLDHAVLQSSALEEHDAIHEAANGDLDLTDRVVRVNGAEQRCKQHYDRDDDRRPLREEQRDGQRHKPEDRLLEQRCSNEKAEEDQSVEVLEGVFGVRIKRFLDESPVDERRLHRVEECHPGQCCEEDVTRYLANAQRFHGEPVHQLVHRFPSIPATVAGFTTLLAMDYCVNGEKGLELCLLPWRHALVLDLFFLNFSRSPIQYSLHRRADFFIFSMNTADPTARPAHSFFEFADCSCNMLLSGLVLLNKCHPADPFIAAEGRKAL